MDSVEEGLEEDPVVDLVAGARVEDQVVALVV